ncbi:MAG TPA: SPOR domain-containing protein [Stellaceae bacterium]
MAGLATAIYLERLRDASSSPAPASLSAMAPAGAPIVAVSDAHEAAMIGPAPDGSHHDPMAAAAAPPTPTAVAELPAEPRAGSTTPHEETVPTQTAMLEAPPALPTPSIAAPVPSVAVTHRYWVEYGVFVGTRYAKRLQQALAAQGLDATLAPTRAPDGRPLVRVRSAPLPDYAQARAAAQSARSALKISTLVHRVAAPAPIAVAATPQLAPAPDRGYWVQFGAFPHRHQAARLQSELARGGLETVVSSTRGTSGRTLFYVRSVGFADHQSAVAAAHRGQDAAKVDFLVGRSTARSASRAGEATPSQPLQVTRKTG